MHQYWFLNCTKTVLMIKINHEGVVTPDILECEVELRKLYYEQR